MADAFIGEIRLFPYSFVPQGWYICNGQELNVNGNQALYAVIGNTWGGTPNQTFKVPSLQGLCVMNQGTGPGLTPRAWGATTVGTQTVALSSSQLPPHDHTLTLQVPSTTNIQANTEATPTANQSWLARPVNVTGASAANTVFAYTKNIGQQPDNSLHAATISVGGGNTAGGVDAHENRQPYLTFVFCINNDGIFPVRN
jgi:microcystin-dependent protein